MSFPLLLVVACAALFVGAMAALAWGRPQGPRRSMASLLTLIRKVPFLSSMSEEDLARFGRVIRELRVPAGVYVVREHRAGEAMYVVVAGTLHILKRGAVEDTLISVAGPGDIIGEMALLTGAKRIASVRAITSCILLQFDRDDFHEILAASSDAHTAVWAACDEHSIDLSMADHEQTRAVGGEDRRQWIAARESVSVVAGTVLVPQVDRAFVAVIAGAIAVDGHEREAPCLLPLAPTSRLVVMRSGRICWLGQLPS